MTGQNEATILARRAAAPAGREGAATADEPRRHVRYYYHPTPRAHLSMRGALREGEAQLHDVSLGGAGLLTHREIGPGSVVFIQLPTSQPGLTITQLAEVVHAQRLGPLSWLIGCKFLCNLRDEELQQVVTIPGTTQPATVVRP
jgi:hypothetical protein